MASVYIEDSKVTREKAIEQLRAEGFSLVEEGSAVIVIGARDRIPVDRQWSVFDSIRETRARRFESVEQAVRVLVGIESLREEL